MLSDKKLLKKLRKVMGATITFPSLFACSSQISRAEVNFEFDRSTGTLHFSGNGVINGDWQRGFGNKSYVKRLVIDEGISGIGGVVKDKFGAFKGFHYLEEVVLPKSLISIGSGAFYECYRLEKIDLPKSLTEIGKSAFGCCSELKVIDLPESLTSIGDYAFYNCYSLEKIDLPKSLTEIGESAFEYCESLSKICIPEGISYIASDVFKDCIGLVEVILPSSITGINERAFNNCYSLERITIPPSVTYIGKCAFYRCYSLSDVKFLMRTGSAMLAPTLSIFEDAFCDCENLKKISVPEYAKIKRGAFDGCVEISRISIVK